MGPRKRRIRSRYPVQRATFPGRPVSGRHLQLSVCVQRGILWAMAATTPAFYDKTDEQRAIIEMVRQFVDEQILPNAEHYDHEDEFPAPIVDQMKELGLFGGPIPEEHGGMGLDLTTYVRT